jgi:hypothetical protein
MSEKKSRRPFSKIKFLYPNGRWWHLPGNLGVGNVQRWVVAHRALKAGRRRLVTNEHSGLPGQPGMTAAIVGDGPVGLLGVLSASRLGAERSSQ